MPKTPPIVDASTILATKAGTAPPAPSDSPQRSESERPSDQFVDLNFKVMPDFRQRFKRAALDADLSAVQLLRQLFEAYEREQGR